MILGRKVFRDFVERLFPLPSPTAPVDRKPIYRAPATTDLKKRIKQLRNDTHGR